MRARQPAPEAGPSQLVVDVEAAGVNFRDIYERESPYGREPPFVAGVEGAGTVAAVGDGGTEPSVGDRVAWTAAPGSYAEQVAVDAEFVEFEGRPHLALAADGWEEVAASIDGWLDGVLEAAPVASKGASV